MKKYLALLVSMLMVPAVVSAHEIRAEEEFTYAPITQPNNSKSIVGYLDKGDVDVYNMLVTPEDMPGGSALISGNVLPPACKQYKNFYPTIALVGYGLPEPDVELPMDLPYGMGAIVVEGRRVKRDKRPIYTTSDVEMNKMIEEHMEQCSEEGIDLSYVDGDLSWFLPHGVTQECLHCTPWACPMEDSLFTPVFVPGYYQVWVYNKTNRHGDYNLSLGIGEEGETCEGLAQSADMFQAIVDNDYLHLPYCVPAGVSGFETCEDPSYY